MENTHKTPNMEQDSAKPPFNFSEDDEDDCIFVLPPECQLQRDKRVSFDTSRNEYIVIPDEDTEEEEETEEEGGVYYSRVAHEIPEIREEEESERIEILDEIESLIGTRAVGSVANESKIVNEAVDESKIVNEAVDESKVETETRINTEPPMNKEMSESQQVILNFVSQIRFTDRLKEEGRLKTSPGTEIRFEESKGEIEVESIPRIENNPFIVQDKLRIRGKEREK